MRIPSGWTPLNGLTEPNAVPVVYLHGLGFGLVSVHLLGWILQTDNGSSKTTCSLCNWCTHSLPIRCFCRWRTTRRRKCLIGVTCAHGHDPNSLT